MKVKNKWIWESSNHNKNDLRAIIAKNHLIMLNPYQSSEVKAHLKMEDDLLSALLWQYFNQVPHGFRTQIQ